MKLKSNNVISLFDNAALCQPDRSALIFGSQIITFRELQKKTSQCATMLKKQGLGAGDRVILMVPMSPELYIAMLAVIRCGATAVFVDPWISMRQIIAFSAFASPNGFIGVPKSHILRLLHPRLTRIRVAVSTGSVFCGLPARCSLNQLQQYSSAFDTVPVSENTSALITFTSGSSGTPKGANRTHGFLTAQYEALCAELDYQSDDVDMPMFPVFALRNLAAGITSVIPSMDFRCVADVDPIMISNSIQQHSVTLVTASPPFVDKLTELKTPVNLRRIFTGGAPVTGQQLKRWHECFGDTKIDIIYGSTEAEPVAHISSHERLAAENCEGFCCGKPSPLVQTRVVRIQHEKITPDELDAVTLPQGKVGELLVAGQHVCRDYYNNPEAVLQNKVIEADGNCWHRMGDTGYFDHEGRFFLTGRVHSTISRNGKTLHAQLVEDEIQKTVPDAKRVAALEMDGKLFVVIQGEPIESPKERIDADEIIFTKKAIPLDPRHNSKVDYTKLRNLVERGKL